MRATSFSRPSYIPHTFSSEPSQNTLVLQFFFFKCVRICRLKTFFKSTGGRIDIVEIKAGNALHLSGDYYSLNRR